MEDPSIDLTMAFLRALQQKEYVVAMAVAKDLERLRPSDPNVAMFKELIAQAIRQYSTRPPVKKAVEAPPPVEKEASSDDDEEKDDGMDWDNIGNPEAIEKLKKLGVMK